MKSRFRTFIFFIMITFAIVISVGIAVVYQYKLEKQVLKNEHFRIEQIEKIILHSLSTIDKVYHLSEDELETKMEEKSIYLQELYEQQPDFEQWDFEALKTSLGMDIYIINDNNQVTYSSFKEDIGLDFSLCCKTFSQLLDKRRQSGKFFSDGMDLQQKTGEFKKYSYMSTKDKKYLLELGYSLDNDPIFHEFNVMRVIKELEQSYPNINEINILNTDGFVFGEPMIREDFTKEREKAFNQTVKTKRTTEIHSGDESILYRYVFYRADETKGISTDRIVEISYNDKELQKVLADNKKTFFIQLAVILVVAIILSFIISRWVAKPMYFAFHDSLTGLRNRAAFDELLKRKFCKNKESTALLMLDLDNFKLVNDHLGHDEGDHLLKQVADTMREVTKREDLIFRFGGDEFILILQGIAKTEAEEVAKNIIDSIQTVISQKQNLTGLNISASIGIAFAPEHGINPDILYKKADIALYASKLKGKNQYQIYHNDLGKF